MTQSEENTAAQPRPVRVLLGTIGMDQHEVGAIAVARLLRNAGMEVIYLGRFNLPEHIVRAAAEEDADLIGLSCHSWEYLYYVDELIGLIRERNLDIPVVVGGSVVTPRDAREVKDKGVAASFGPGARPEAIVATIEHLARHR